MSKRRSRAIARIYIESGKSLCAEVPHLTINLGLDVERFLTAPTPSLVAGDHQLADLLAQLGVVGHRWAKEGLHLGFHVQGGLAARLAAVGFRLYELAHLLGLLGKRR